MSSAPSVKSVKSILAVDESSMRTNKVDQTSSFLLSMIILIGIAVFMLAVLFIMRSMSTYTKPFVVPAESIEGRGLNAEGFERDFDPPGSDEVEQLSEPALEQTLQMVTEAISNISASLESLESSMAANGTGTGRGDSRQAGPEGEGDKNVPRSERWELKFTARDKRNYALQLESFKINIGAIGGGISTVDYVTNVASSPSKKSGTSKEFKGVLYFMSTTANVLEQYEKQILQAAGVTNAGRQVLKFVPKETEELLAQAEAAYYIEKRSKDLRIADIAKTVFECRQKKEVWRLRIRCDRSTLSRDATGQEVIVRLKQVLRRF